MHNLAQMFLATVVSKPNEIAVAKSGDNLTWGDLYAHAWHVSGQLRDHGVRRGEVIGLYCGHSLTQVVAILGCALADCPFTVINSHLKPAYIEHQIRDCQARVVIVGTANAQRITDLAQIVVRIDDTADIASPPDPHSVDTRNIQSDVGTVIYTSGSTGLPKGVVVPLRVLVEGARIVSDYLEITDKDSILSILPFSFDYGLNQLMSAIYTGARIVLHDYFFPQDVINALATENITGMAAVPTLWPHLFARPIRNKPLFQDLRYITTAGGPHGKEIVHKLNNFFPHTQIIIMYGFTESFRCSYLPFSQLFERPTSVGKPVPGSEVLILDSEDNPCPPGQLGELVQRGPFASYGYLNNQELNQKIFLSRHTGGPGTRPETFVRSGDLAYMDEEGYIYLSGRIDSQIKSQGYRVSPAEVELAALKNTAVKHAAVFGRPDPRLGQAIVLCVTPNKEGGLDQAQILLALKQELPYYAVPTQIVICDQLPQTATGKIDYRTLEQMTASNLS